MEPLNARNDQQPHAVLIGLDSLQGLQAARILADRHIPVIALAKDPHHYGCKTKVCRKIIFTDTDGDALIETLAALGSQLHQRAVLFPCEDANVLLVSRHREELAHWYQIILPPAEAVEMLMNKISFYTYAMKHDLPIPPTYFLYSRVDAEQVLSEIRYPCILKPSNSATPEWEHNCMRKAFKVTTPADLLALYDMYRRWTDIFIVQQWIAGPETNYHVCNCYFNSASEPVVTFTTRKLRQWPPNTGIGCLREDFPCDVVLQETVRLFRSVQYRGLGYLEMKRDDRSGRFFIVEPNIGRPTGGSSIAEGAGVELLYTMYCDALGLPLPANRQQKYSGLKWINLRQDFQSALYHWWRGELSLKEWRESWRGPKVQAVFSWRDPGPFMADVTRVARVLMSRQERRKRDYDHPLTQKTAATTSPQQ